MFISLAGDGAQFTNKLFNTLEIKPKSWICLNTFSIKKNEVITIGDTAAAFFYADYNNIYYITIPPGQYDIYSLCKTFNLAATDFSKRFSVRAEVESTLFQNTIRIYCDNLPIPELDFGIFHNITDNPGLNNYNIVWGPQLQNGDSPRDISGNATYKNVGNSSVNQSYCVIKSAQPLGTAQQNQTIAVMPYVLAGAPIYVSSNGSGTPGTGYDNPATATNFINNACAQATYQKYDDNDSPETQDNGNAAAGGSPYVRSADLLRQEGAIIFVAGSQGSNKDFVICNGDEELGRSPDPLPQDFSNFTTGDNSIYLWFHWLDPRDANNYNKFRIGFNKVDPNTGAKEWTIADVKTVGKLEERLCVEGCKYTITFQAQKDDPNWVNFYHPVVKVDSINNKSGEDFTHIIAFWDMDTPTVGAGAEEFFYNNSGDIAQGQFRVNNPVHCAYEYLYGNVGENTYNGAKASGHYWGTEFNVQTDERADGYFKGSAFELRSGNGAIDWSQSQSLNNTPGLYSTAFSVSRIANAGAAGYKNAFYKFPDMYGGKSERDHKGVSETTPSGTILPASMPQTTIGTHYMNIAFRLDNSGETDYQIIYAFEGDDKATGVATDPFTMIGVKIGDTTILAANGKPNAADREVVNITDMAGAPFEFKHSTWYYLTVAFQSASGETPSGWLICGVQENGAFFKGTTTFTGYPTRPIFGLGGNDLCDGNQTVSTGFIGVIKLFKIGFYSSEDQLANTPYDIQRFITLTCSDYFETDGDLNYWTKQRLIESVEIIDDDMIVDQMGGFSHPEWRNFLTTCLGQFPQGTPGACANYNPYDTLFSAPIWRQNFQENLDFRLVDNNDGEFQKYLPGGQFEVKPSDCGFILNQKDYGLPLILLEMGFPDNTNQVYQMFAPPPEGQKENGFNEASEEIDTEVGLNDNRFHIDNLPIQSYNGVVGSMDRAIYQSQSVLGTRKTGPNYVNNSFTVPQKVWIPLNNAGSLHLNEFNVKITDIEDVLDEEVLSSQMTIEIKDEKEMLISK